MLPRKRFLIALSAFALAACERSPDVLFAWETGPDGTGSGPVPAMSIHYWPAQISGWGEAVLTFDANGGVHDSSVNGAPVFSPDPYAGFGDVTGLRARFYDGRSEIKDLTGLEWRMQSADTTLLRFVRVTASTGHLERLGSGFTKLTVGLFRTADGQAVIGPFTVPVEVRFDIPPR